MKIFVAGATGRVGEQLVKNLVEKGQTVYAAARHEEKILASEAIIPVHLDLHKTVAEIAVDLADAEVVYFVAGSRGADLLQTDLYGAVKLMQAAEAKGITRYIQLSSIFALEPEKWPNTIRDYYIAKFFSDRWLLDNTSLDYTILQPGTLLETPGTGKITTNITNQRENSITDVSNVLADLIDYPNTIQKVIVMSNGNTPISEALAAI